MLIKSLLVFSITIAFISCRKTPYHSDSDEFIDFKVENSQRSFGPTFSLTGGQFRIELRGDSIIYINAKPPGVEGIGFYLLKKGIPDGSYDLKNINKGYYDYSSESYTTNTSFGGYITVKKGLLAGNNRIKIMEGNFEFTAIDSISNKIIHITNGNYRMSY